MTTNTYTQGQSKVIETLTTKTFHYDPDGNRTGRCDNEVVEVREGFYSTELPMMAVAPDGLKLTAMNRLSKTGNVAERVMVAQQRHLPPRIAERLMADTNLDVLYHLGCNPDVDGLDYELGLLDGPVLKDVLLEVARKVSSAPTKATWEWFHNDVHHFIRHLVQVVHAGTSDELVASLLTDDNSLVHVLARRNLARRGVVAGHLFGDGGTGDIAITLSRTAA